MYNSELNNKGLPVSLFSGVDGAAITENLYRRYEDAFFSSIDPSSISNDYQNASEILQLWQNLDNWYQYYPEVATEKIKSLSNILLKLRAASTTDAPFDFYELLLFWNLGTRPELFNPVIFTDSVYNVLITNTLEYSYEMLYTTVKNMINRAKNPDAPLIAVNEAYKGYQIPEVKPITNNTPTTTNTAAAQKKKVFFFLLVVAAVVLIANKKG